jgi:uncharacterized protein with HEPN domain
MQPRTIHSLRDIATAAAEVISIAEATDSPTMDRISGLAIERLLLIIGEAAARIREDEPNVFDLIPNGPQLIGMRNVIVHGYDRINWTRIQDAIRDELPHLVSAVSSILGESTQN